MVIFRFVFTKTNSPDTPFESQWVTLSVDGMYGCTCAVLVTKGARPLVKPQTHLPSN